MEVVLDPNKIMFYIFYANIKLVPIIKFNNK